MTPQEKLKDIKSKNYEWSSEDVKWLIALAEKQERMLTRVISHLKDLCVVSNHAPYMKMVIDEIKIVLAQDPQEKSE